MESIQTIVNCMTEEQLLKLVCALRSEDYRDVLFRLERGEFGGAVQYLRYDAADRVSDMRMAMTYVYAVRRFAGLDKSKE